MLSGPRTHARCSAWPIRANSELQDSTAVSLISTTDSVSMASDSEATPNPSQTLDHETSPNKRLKTLEKSQLDFEPILESNEHGQQNESPPPSPSSMESETKVCGVCLSEEGKAIGGFVDGCDHHFCFVCIMEWARVDTRCPLCKCRFTTVRRPPVEGVFPTERIVNVPVRSQDYYILGITTISHSDPYAQFHCSVCHSMTDESLVILCDLCDWAAHTYCVGLGTTIPDGEWFCQDCAISRAESHVSIFDIVRESIDPDAEASESVARTNYNVVDRASESSVRTMRCRQNVHDRIQSLRENWNAFRGGHLSFASRSVDCGGKISTKLNVGAAPSNIAGHPHSSSSTSCQRLASQVNCSSDTLHNRGTEDIKKAWKLLDIAKSTHQTRNRTIIVHQPANYGLGEGNTPRDMSNIKSNFLVARNQPVQDRELVSIVKNNRNLSLGLESENLISYKYEKQKQSRMPAKDAFKCDEILPTTDSERLFELSSSRNVHTLFHDDTCNRNVNERDGYARSTSSVGSQTCHAKSELRAVSSCRVDVPLGKAMVENGYSQKKISREDSAKSEIQSLVKLNLKLLNRSKNLGNDKFKEVARLSTHSIMAACGLEHPKPDVPNFSCCVCCHNEKIQKLHKSTLMPSSCRECFYIFVKDVVNYVLLEKAGHG